jgi:hypothetical protein
MPSITALKGNPHMSAIQQRKAKSNQHFRYIAIKSLRIKESEKVERIKGNNSSEKEKTASTTTKISDDQVELLWLNSKYTLNHIDTLEAPQHAKRIKAPRLTVFENQEGLLQIVLR